MNNSPLNNNTIDFPKSFNFFFQVSRPLVTSSLAQSLCDLIELAKHRANWNIHRRGGLGASLQHNVLKADTNLHKRLKFSHTTWRGVHLVRETCDFSGNSRKWIFYDLKLNCAHPCQESIEMVCLWLFVTSAFFRDECRTVNPLHVLYIRLHLTVLFASRQF